MARCSPREGPRGTSVRCPQPPGPDPDRRGRVVPGVVHPGPDHAGALRAALARTDLQHAGHRRQRRHDHRHPRHATPSATGNLNLTTVSVSGESVTAFEAISRVALERRGRGADVVGLSAGQERADVDQQNTADFVDSQDSAIAAASCELGYPHKFGVITVFEHGSLERQARTRRRAGQRRRAPGDQRRHPARRAFRQAAEHQGRRRGDPGREEEDGRDHAGTPAARQDRRHPGDHGRHRVRDTVHRRPGARQPDRRPVGRTDVRARHHGQGRPRRPDQGPIHRRHRHDHFRRQGRRDRRHRAEDDRRAGQGRNGVPGPGRQLRRRSGRDARTA